MDTLKGAIGLCVKIHEMHGTFTSNKVQCDWLLANVKNIMTVLQLQLDRGAVPPALEGPLVVLKEDLRASDAVLEEFGRCSDLKRFVFGSKHSSQFATAGDRLHTSLNFFCHAVNIHLALDERDAGARRWHMFEEALRRDVQEYEHDLSVAMQDPNLSTKLEDLGISSKASTRHPQVSALAPAAGAPAILTFEDAQSCSWFMRSEELNMEYKEIKKGQPPKEVRLGKPGSFGDVISALHCGVTPVAVKKLRAPSSADDVASSDLARASFAAFVSEVSFAFALNHPNIVRTLGGVVDALEEPPCWIVMERLQRSLAEVPVDADRKMVLNEEQKLDIIMGMCSALVYLHSSKRDDSEFTEAHAHCDLKPENIMYQDGVVKLIDFGIAKVSMRSTRGTIVKGTHNWMSPEQGLMDARKTYTLCDMFSFGLIVKWLLVGARDDVPFKDAQTDEITREHARLHSSVGGLLHPYVADLSLVPPVFRLLIQLCTATDASKRLTAPQAMWELLQLKSRLAAADVAHCLPASRSSPPPALPGGYRQLSPPPPTQAAARAAGAAGAAAAAARALLLPLGHNSPSDSLHNQRQASPTPEVSIAEWTSLLEKFQGALTPESVASVKYYRNTALAASLCDEVSDAEADNGALANAAHYAAAAKSLHTIVAGQSSPTSAEVLSSLLALVKSALPQVEAAQDAAKTTNEFSRAAELQVLKVSLLELVSKAENLLQEYPEWPCVPALQRFSLPLQRHTTHNVIFKQWFQRFFVLKDGFLYYSDGKKGHPDSREGTLSFMRSNPAPDGRYRVDLLGYPARGASVKPCVTAIDGQEFAFEISFADAHGGYPQKILQVIRLAAADEATRQRCIAAIRAVAGAGQRANVYASPIQPQHVAATAALTNTLFGMKSVRALTAAWSALGQPLTFANLEAAKFRFDVLCSIAHQPQLKSNEQHKYRVSIISELRNAGFDGQCMEKAGFIVSDLKRGGYDLASLKNYFSLEHLKMGRNFLSKEPFFGFSNEELILAEHPQATLRHRSFVYATLGARIVKSEEGHNYGYGEFLKDEEGQVRAEGKQLFEMPSGWELAPADADASHVCRAHSWQCSTLYLADEKCCHTRHFLYLQHDYHQYAGQICPQGSNELMLQEGSKIGYRYWRDSFDKDVLIRKPAAARAGSGVTDGSDGSDGSEW